MEPAIAGSVALPAVPEQAEYLPVLNDEKQVSTAVTSPNVLVSPSTEMATTVSTTRS